jgi:gliding motility-associated-like protein
MRRLLLLFLVLHVITISRSQDFTNKGKDFWIGYGNHVRMITGGAPETMQLYITSDVNTKGQVTVAGTGFSQSFNVSANQIVTINIPRSAALTDEGLSNSGIHVTAERPVVVYSFIYVNAISGATLCLPTNTLGREYYSINFDQVSNEPAASYSYFFAIAADTGTTTVEIIPARNTLGGRGAGTPFTVSLQQGQVYQVLAAEDLTGSSIRSINNGSGCKRLAVFCGSGKIAIGCGGAGTSDNLYQQMYSTSTWGKTYITVPSINEPNHISQYNYYRIFKSDPTARVFLNGVEMATASFINGRYATIQGSDVPNHISSDKPILVAQYLTTQGCGGNSGEGDPEMIYLNPVEQTVTHVTLNSMQPAVNTNINQHFINAVLKNVPEALNNFKIDGTSFGSSFVPHPNAPGYAYAQIPVSSGTHTINSDTPFNAISYGFGNAESYGYSAGTNLKDLYQFVTIKNDYATVNFPAGCVRSPFKFSITFPYQPLKITWRFNGLFADTTVDTPVYDSSWVVNGRTIYRYLLDKSYRIDNIGTYPISLLVINPTIDGCSGEQQIDYDLEIFDRPKAEISYSLNNCSTDSVAFTDITDGLGRPLIHWYWNFSDASADRISLDDNPLHKFSAAGTYTIRHAAITDVGCLSDTISRAITIAYPPVSRFTHSAVTCEKREISFTDQSTVQNATIIKWTYDFGDGTTIESTTGGNVKHIYDSAGVYTVSLITESSAGCISLPYTVTITVHHLPQPAFGTPEVCLADPFAQFSDSSTIADGSEAQFTYLWQFGDGVTSLLKNPQHKYTATGIYTLAVTVTSKDGCQGKLEKSFTVNGSIPQAGFVVRDAASLCSNKEVAVNDQSTVDFGSIVRVEIYWDYLNDPTVKTVDEEPTPGKVYSHKYPDFGDPRSKDFQVRYVSYSGINCVSQQVKTITVKASPEILFAALTPVCEELTPFNVTAATEIFNFVGTGTYSGPGISPQGLFNPSVSGPGVHTLRYHFEAENGCSTDKEQQQEVYPTPGISAGADKRVLEDGSAILDGQAQGNITQYLWTPGTWLDNTTIATPKVTPLEDITYTLTVTSAQGCTASDRVFVKVLRKPVIPNAFTPNGDGINDTWVIKYLDAYPDCTVDIYNRNGQRVFYSVGYGRPWDGRINGNPLPIGTYYYIINPHNGRKTEAGSVTIIR